MVFFILSGLTKRGVDGLQRMRRAEAPGLVNVAADRIQRKLGGEREITVISERPLRLSLHAPNVTGAGAALAKEEMYKRLLFARLSRRDVRIEVVE